MLKRDVFLCRDCIWQKWYTCGHLEVEFPNGICGSSLHVDEQALNYFLGHLHKIQTVQSPCALDYLTVSRCLKATSTDEMHLKALSIAFKEEEWKATNPGILDRNWELGREECRSSYMSRICAGPELIRFALKFHFPQPIVCTTL